MLEPQERLRNAVIQGNLSITKRILSRFPELWLNVDPSCKGWGNLHYASYHGNYLICFYLISFHNKNPQTFENNYSQMDLLTFDKLTVLHLTLIKHHSQTLHYLLQEFPGDYWLNFPGGELKQTPLHYSCMHGFEEGVKLLLEFEADWELQDKNGNTCLHYCFQYGNYGCIKGLLKFILESASDKDEGMSRIKTLEQSKNEKGWLAIDYSSSFELVQNYEDLKKVLYSKNYIKKDMLLLDVKDNETYDSLLHDEKSSQTLVLNNKVLASPIVPVSQAHLTELDKLPSSTSEESVDSITTKSRAHSRSLPTNTLSEIFSKASPIDVRKRSNTSSNYKPPNPIGTTIGSPRTPNTNGSPNQFPSLRKTSSLKSFTISPSVRVNSAIKGDITDSPQSSNTNYSPMNNSPISVQPSTRKTDFPTNAFQISNLQIGEGDSWLAIKSNSGNISSQTIHAQPKYSPYTDLVSEMPIDPTAVSSGTSSPIRPRRKSIYNISRSASSTSSIAAKIAFNSSRSSLNETSHRADSTPSLRKSRSSSTILNPIMKLSRSSSTSSSASLITHENGNTTPKRSNISNISFSRIR